MKTGRASLLCGVLSAVLFSPLTGCSLPEIGSAEMLRITSNELVLQWDASPDTVDHYTVYSRVHGSTGWAALADVSAEPQPECTIGHSAMGNGDFDFAVVAVDSAGQRSTHHSSLDATAEPHTGWYVAWHIN